MQTKSTLAAPKMSFSTNEFYLKSTQEMADSFADFPGALESTLEIAERCEVEIALGGQLIPRFEWTEGLSEKEYLRKLVLAGMAERYGDPLPAHAVERMEMELAVIDKMGFNAYFLIVWDFIDWAKKNGVAVGPGRGSAAGSIIAYTLRITDVDPLAYDLLFERFLNAERVSMPDIDIDFSVRGRERVMAYVKDKYGADRVAQIITFGRMFPRAATQGRRPRPRPRLRRRRQALQAHPGPDHGPLPVLQGVPGAGRGPRERGGEGPGGGAGRRGRAGPGGDRPQQRRSTRPPS